MKKLTTENWIQKAKDVHGDKFDYSVTVYSTAKTKLDIICLKHGKSSMLPHHHIKGYGCSQCGKDAINKNKKLSQKEFLNRIKDIPNLSFEKTIYKDKRSKVIVTCKIHGDYETTAEVLLKGCGCRQCSPRGEWNLKDESTFIEQAKNKHNNLYSYSSVEYKGCFDKVLITCPRHGNFLQTPSIHLRGSGCPKCRFSKGELIIDKYLKENNFTFITQKTFKGCKDQKRLKFDFYIPSLNLCIEFDGEQHFRTTSSGFWGGKKGLKNRQRKDQIKTTFCKENNIKLLRIKHDENIHQKLNEFFRQFNIIK